MCPNEKNPPDNWSFLEKFLNAVEFSSKSYYSGINDEIGKEIRKDVVNEILTKLRDSLQRKKNRHPKLGIWIGDSSIVHGSAEIQTAEFICQKKLNLGELWLLNNY